MPGRLRFADDRALLRDRDVALADHLAPALGLGLDMLAEILRRAVNRLLADLADEGLIKVGRDVLVVVDVDRLARTVER